MVQTIELDIWSPSKENQKESSSQDDNEDGHETFERAEDKTFNFLQIIDYIKILYVLNSGQTKKLSGPFTFWYLEYFGR